MNPKPKSDPLDNPLPLDWFDFDLPKELIAQQPANPRHTSRLLVLHRTTGLIEHLVFEDFPNLLKPTDLLVVNKTQVLKARIWCTDAKSRRVELLLCEPQGEDVQSATTWNALGRPRRALQKGSLLKLPDGSEVSVLSRSQGTLCVRAQKPWFDIMTAFGEVPLPPYILRPEGPNTSDPHDYQSIFAKQPGAVAAPTASLHFTEEILKALQQKKVRIAKLLLHVGPGTFLPVREDHAEDVRGHKMHEEFYSISDNTLEAISETKNQGGRVIAIGTTSVRALESCFATGKKSGKTSLFIYPGFAFRAVDALITNFHLPRSTLLMLVSALASRENVLLAYAEAIKHQYRFFSYGDAMLIC